MAAAQAVMLDIRFNQLDKELVTDALGATGMIGIILSTVVVTRKIELVAVEATCHLSVTATRIGVEVLRDNEATGKDPGIGDRADGVCAPRNGAVLVLGDPTS